MDFKSILIGALSTALLFITMGASDSKNNSPIPALEISDLPATDWYDDPKGEFDLGGAVYADGKVYQVIYGQEGFLGPWVFRLVKVN